MTHLHWIAFRMYLPALVCLLLAFASTWWLTGTPVPLGGPLRWLPHALLGLAMLLGAIASVRLLRRDIRDALICGCGGLLGHARQGRYGTYRACATCGHHHAVRG